jgi:hypothetical protein
MRGGEGRGGGERGGGKRGGDRKKSKDSSRPNLF